MRRVDLFLRVDLVLAAVVAVVAGAPPAVRVPLLLLATVAVLDRLVRLRTGGAVDALLVAAGGTLVTLILTGVILHLAGVRLRPVAWALALGAVALAGLVTAFRKGAGAAPLHLGKPSSAMLRQLPWAAAAVAVLVLAVSISVGATDRSESAPLQMSLGQVHATSVTVTVSCDTSVGPVALQTATSNGTTLSYPLFTVSAGHPVTTVVQLPTKGRYTVSLSNPNQTKPLRTLTLDR